MIQKRYFGECRVTIRTAEILVKLPFTRWKNLSTISQGRLLEKFFSPFWMMHKELSIFPKYFTIIWLAIRTAKGDGNHSQSVVTNFLIFFRGFLFYLCYYPEFILNFKILFIYYFYQSAFNILLDKSKVLEKAPINLRDSAAPIPQYLFSRAKAGK